MAELKPVINIDNPDRKIDVIFVHGLGGDYETTWCYKKDMNTFWPMWLGSAEERAGIWSLSYDTSIFSLKAELSVQLSDRAGNILTILANEGIGDRPVVFVCHSLGGLLVKQLLRKACDTKIDNWKKIVEATRGVVFLATPHAGSSLASVAVSVHKYLGFLFPITTDVLVLKAYSSVLQDLNSWYRNNSESIETYVFYEKIPLAVVGIVVDAMSSDPGITGVEPVWVNADHLSISEVKSRRGEDGMVYQHVLRIMNQICNECQNAADAVRTTPEQIDISRLPNPGTPLIGRQNELEQIQQAFENPQTYLAIINAAGGIGKSALTDAWLKKIQPNYGGIKRVFAWSFYSQGTHNTQTSSTPFFQAALPFFGWKEEMPKDDIAKGRALAQLLREQLFILILDGLEPLQHAINVLDGELKDVGLKAFLEEVRLYGITQSLSLILISSRQPLMELEEEWELERFVKIDLQILPDKDGAKLLQHLGVRGTDFELRQASREMGGHALALMLLGRLLKEKFLGNIERRKQLSSLWDERKQGGHAQRVLRFYVERYWQQETPELAFLQLLGLFDRPMGFLEKSELVEKADCAEPLRTLDNVGWKRLETSLEIAGVLLHVEGDRYQWDCHPIIRDYFGQNFQGTQPKLFHQAHQVLFDYYQSTAKYRPDTLDELDPLYRAVVHGCLAGEYKKSLEEVYWKRIMRGKEEYYSFYKLGSYSQDLAAFATFFTEDWVHPVQCGLFNVHQEWLLSNVSFCLMSLGRLEEAIEPRLMHLQLSEGLEDWADASIGAQSLVDVYCPLGRLTEAALAARKAIEHAKRSGDLYEQMGSHAYLATILHRQGFLDLAQLSFECSEKFQQEFDPGHPKLQHIQGFRYCALLLDRAGSVEEYEKVLNRGESILRDAQHVKNLLLSVALGHLNLARILMRLQRDEESLYCFDQAVDGIREAGTIDILPEFLIDRANFHLQSSKVDRMSAAYDLEEASSIIRRSHMRLYDVDCQLAWCRYYLVCLDRDKAYECWVKTRDLIQVTGYKLREKEVQSLKEHFDGEKIF